MASSVVISTLMVLMSNSDQDMEMLWNTIGGVNDPSGNKHEIDLELIMIDGNFRSALVDDWANQSFSSMSVQGTNIFGDILWETEFDVSGKSWMFTTWLANGNIIYSTALTSGTQDALYSSQNYRFRTSPSGSTDRSWFAVSDTDLSYSPLPQIFVPRSPNIPFSLPVYLDGMLGCWNKDTLNNVQMVFSNESITPNDCIAACNGIASVALITLMLNCICADVDPSNPPEIDSNQCYFACKSTALLCGGLSDNFGSAYHVQGQNLPGYVSTSSLFSQTYETISDTIKIDVSEISIASTTSPAFISNISLTSTPLDNYQVLYSASPCSDPNGTLKVLSADGVTSVIFKGDGRVEHVDILMLRCMKIQFVSFIPSLVHVQLWGPNVSSEHIEASALVIRGKSNAETTSSPITTVTTTSISPPSTTSSSSTNTASSLITSSPSSSTLAETTISTVATTENKSQVHCYCPCNDSDLNLTDEQLQNKLEEIKRNLKMNVSNLSSTIRRLTSAEDSRISAVSIGYVGVGILVVIFSAIVFIDSALLYKDMKKLFDNIKNRFCVKNTDEAKK